MDCPGSSSLPRCLSPPEQPDRLLTELHEAQIALTIAEQHIKLWRVNVATGQVPHRPRISFLAHEALDEAGKAIDRIAELLKIQANGTLATQQGHVAQTSTESSPTGTSRGEPAGGGDRIARERASMVAHIGVVGAR